MRLLGVLAPALLFAVGCDDTPEAPPAPDPDQARECVPDGMDAGPGSDGGPALACADGEVCVQGRCYPACSDDADCGPREACDPSGACVRRSGPEPDAGPMPDAGPPMPCDDVECPEPTVCHPLSGTCVECSAETRGAAPGEPGFCSGLQPICDIANGECVEAGPAQCAPCNDESECNPGDGSFVGTCVERMVMDVHEQVCMRTCDADTPCPPGLTCDEAEGICIPPAGASCTTWRAAIERRSCLGDEDCNPLGASAAFFVNACEGEVIPTPPDAGVADGGVAPDAGAPTPGTCVQPCGVEEDCFDQAGGQQCLGSGAILFCQVPPSGP